ncbi:MAG: Ig-like domain-containing protein [Thermoproteota archaeon]|nr:Ig-like domain-containing protein [Thermoproteota archaeon]
MVAFYFGSEQAKRAQDVLIAQTKALSGAPDATAPTISNIAPADMSKDIPISSYIIATFSEPMRSSSITNNTFTILDAKNNRVPGTVALTPDGLIAQSIPLSRLAYDTKYTAIITTGVTDQTGNPMLSDKKWSFTTVAQPPTPTPTPTPTQ